MMLWGAAAAAQQWWEKRDEWHGWEKKERERYDEDELFEHFTDDAFAAQECPTGVMGRQWVNEEDGGGQKKEKDWASDDDINDKNVHPKRYFIYFAMREKKMKIFSYEKLLHKNNELKWLEL